MFYYGLLPIWVFSAAAFAFGMFQVWPHLKRRECSWYRIGYNCGLSFSPSPPRYPPIFQRKHTLRFCWRLAVSDGVTGIIRHYYFRRNGFNVKLKKHWTGSLGYFLTALPIALWLLGGGIIGKAV
ncbi:hypothetical protein [Thermococcus sp. Bubb.Bath]|uniref:hypothetical protein n=1 Tax=Thermococcus sp. Bubb.Bath TaxID=1638242 RepID=UPI003182CFFA